MKIAQACLFMLSLVCMGIVGLLWIGICDPNATQQMIDNRTILAWVVGVFAIALFVVAARMGDL